MTQTNTAFTTGSGGAAFATGVAQTTANSPNTGNLASVAITGLQNQSDLTQDGVQNTADVSMLNGGSGNTDDASGGVNPGTGLALTPGGGGQPAGRPEGNSSTITQTGRGNYVSVSLGGRATYSAGGQSAGAGNISDITQDQGDAAVTQTTLTSTQTGSTAHRALAYQRGTLDSVTINQSNNALGGAADGSGTDTQSGSLADVSQLSFNSTASVTQIGTNTGIITQGSRNEATNASNQAVIQQTDEGDITSLDGGGGFGGGSTSGSSRNRAEIAQNGVENVAQVVQDAINASASVFQASGTRRDQGVIVQGVSGFAVGSVEQQTAQNDAANSTFNTQNVTASVNQTAGQSGPGAAGAAILQNGRNLSATANQSGGTATVGTSAGTPSNNLIYILQAYDYNSATVTQAGTNLSATVEQRGTGTATRRNLVTINQSNDGNVALARQTQNVGASGATGATAGVPNDTNFPFSRTGANSAEIVISQSGTGGSATVEQRGKGQYASLTQGGTGNIGGILQGELGTNAVAVLTQTGTNNTYYITQNTPGQYIRVTQTGAGNTVAGTSVINGPSGPGNSATTPNAGPAPGAFGGVQ